MFTSMDALTARSKKHYDKPLTIEDCLKLVECFVKVSHKKYRVICERRNNSLSTVFDSPNKTSGYTITMLRGTVAGMSRYVYTNMDEPFRGIQCDYYVNPSFDYDDKPRVATKHRRYMSE